MGNLALNNVGNVRVVNVAVSDTVGTFPLGISRESSGLNSLLWKAPETVDVQCRPLAAVLEEASIGCVAAMKLDIEGMEFRVLKHYFGNAPRSAWPKLILVEYLEAHQGLAGGDVLDLIKSCGYSLSLQTPMNCILERR
jgi:FkbM family methyltransferase